MSTKSFLSIADRGRRICVIFPGALGDFICFLPALQMLAEISPVDLFARSEFAELAPNDVAVYSLEHPEIGRLFGGRSGGGVTTLDFAKYRAVYSWHGSGSREFNERLQAAASGRAQVFPFRPSIAGIHQADYYARCLYAIAAPVRPVLAVRDDALGWCAQYWRQQSLEHHAVLALAPGSGSREKNWPEEFFVEISRWWQQAIGGTVLLLEGPVEEERGGTQRLRECCVTLSGLTLSKLAAVLSRSQLVLGNDSGVTHLAAAVGVPTVALFGPSDPAQWAPRGPSVVILRRALDCSPCAELSMKRCPDRACLTDFSPRDVIAALGRLPQVVTLTRFRAGITV